MTDDSWQSNLRIAQSVLDKMERQSDPIRGAAIRTTLGFVEEELEEVREDDDE